MTKPISLSEFRQRLFPLVKKQQNKTENTIKVYNRSDVYLIRIYKTDEKHAKYKFSKWYFKRGKLELTKEKCSLCGQLLISEVCVNKDCKINKKEAI